MIAILHERMFVSGFMSESESRLGVRSGSVSGSVNMARMDSWSVARSGPRAVSVSGSVSGPRPVSWSESESGLF